MWQLAAAARGQNWGPRKVHNRSGEVIKMRKSGMFWQSCTRCQHDRRGSEVFLLGQINITWLYHLIREYLFRRSDHSMNSATRRRGRTPLVTVALLSTLSSPSLYNAEYKASVAKRPTELRKHCCIVKEEWLGTPWPRRVLSAGCESQRFQHFARSVDGTSLEDVWNEKILPPDLLAHYSF